MTIGFLLAILTGICFGLQGVYGKHISRKSSAMHLSWATFLFALPVVGCWLLIKGLPAVQWQAFLLASGGSFLANLIAVNLFYRALSQSPIAYTMPFTALTPLFLLPAAYVLLGELPGFNGLSGILFIIAGVYSLYASTDSIFAPFRKLFEEPGSRLMLLVAFIWGFSSSLDKVAIQNSSPAFYAVFIHLLLAGAYSLILFGKKSRPDMQWRPLIILGLLSGFIIVFQFSALVYLDVSYVIAFKRAGVLISVILGYQFFGERNFLRNLIGAALIVSGAILLVI